jgi:hypothetical protein
MHMYKRQVAINGDAFHFAANAPDLLEEAHDAVKAIRNQRIVLDVWARHESRKQVGAALIEDLVEDDLKGLPDAISFRSQKLIPLQRAWFDTVYCCVVPVSVKARDLTMRAETQDVGVRYEYDFTLLRNARSIHGHRPAHDGLDYQGRFLGKDYLYYLYSEVRDDLRKGTPNGVKATTNRHDAVAAVRGVPSLGILSTEREHLVDIVSVIGGEELLRGALEISGARIHLMARGGCVCV